MYAAWMDAGPAKLASTHRRVAHLAHGWYMRCERSLDAVLILERAGHAEEAAPIRRCVIEHVVALKWVGAEGNGVLDAVAREHGQNTRKQLEAVTAAQWSVEPKAFHAVLEEIASGDYDPSSDHLMHFRHRVERYGDDHDLPGWLAETALSHPTYKSAVDYCDVSSGQVVPRRAPQAEQLPQQGFATAQLLDALLAVREIFEPKPWEHELDAIVDDYLAITDAVREQDGLPPVDWSTGRVVRPTQPPE